MTIEEIMLRDMLEPKDRREQHGDLQELLDRARRDQVRPNRLVEVAIAIFAGVGIGVVSFVALLAVIAIAGKLANF